MPTETDPGRFETVEPPQAFTPWEKQALDLLLALDRTWLPTLRQQLADARVSARCTHCPSIDILVHDGSPRVPATEGAATQLPPALHGRDTDGMDVEIILIVTDGLVTGLDVWRGDGGAFKPPALDSFGPATYTNAHDPGRMHDSR